MFVVIRGHMFEGEDLQGIAECLLRWQPPLVPWLITFQEAVKVRTDYVDCFRVGFCHLLHALSIIQ